jgi:hypothetical protein
MPTHVEFRVVVVAVDIFPNFLPVFVPGKVSWRLGISLAPQVNRAQDKSVHFVMVMADNHRFV